MASDLRADPRTSDRATASAGESVTHRGTSVGVGVDLHITDQDITSVAGGVADAARAAISKINPWVKPEVNRGGKVRRTKAGAEPFVIAMADLQTSMGAKLGVLNTNPDRIRTQVSVAQAADAVASPVAGLANQLSTIGAISMDSANRDAAAIYRRAAAVAKSDPDVAEAIRPWAAAFSKIAKKGAATRRARKGQPAAAAPAETPSATTGSSTSTTVTTTQR